MARKSAPEAKRQKPALQFSKQDWEVIGIATMLQQPNFKEDPDLQQWAAWAEAETKPTAIKSTAVGSLLAALVIFIAKAREGLLVLRSSELGTDVAAHYIAAAESLFQRIAVTIAGRTPEWCNAEILEQQQWLREHAPSLSEQWPQDADALADELTRPIHLSAADLQVLKRLRDGQVVLLTLTEQNSAVEAEPVRDVLAAVDDLIDWDNLPSEGVTLPFVALSPVWVLLDAMHRVYQHLPETTSELKEGMHQLMQVALPEIKRVLSRFDPPQGVKA